MLRLILKFALPIAMIGGGMLSPIQAAYFYYVTDYPNSLIKAYDSDTGALVQTINGTQGGSIVLDGPTGLAIDPSGRILAASVFSLNNVNAFTPQGTFSTTLISGFTPTVIALDSSQNIYVAEITNNTIYKYSSSGTYLQAISTGISGWAGIKGIAVDSSGQIYASNAASVYRFASDGTQLGSFANGLSSPTGLAFDSSGNLYAASGGGGIYKISTSGTVLATYTTGGSASSVALDPLGNVYAAHANGVDKFSPSGTLLNSFTGSNYYLTQIAVSPINVPEPATTVFAVISAGLLTVVARRKRARLNQ